MAEYIDREEAKKAMLGEFHADIERYGCVIPECFDGDRACILLDLLPPADVRPVVRGRWEWKHRRRGGFRRVTGKDDFGILHTIKVDERYQIDDPYCPFCGKVNESVFLNFCPNCGAEMEGGDAK